MILRCSGKFTWWRITHKASGEVALGWGVAFTVFAPSYHEVSICTLLYLIHHNARPYHRPRNSAADNHDKPEQSCGLKPALPSSSCVCQASVNAVRSLSRTEARKENHVLEVISRGRVQEHWDYKEDVYITFCLRLGLVYFQTPWWVTMKSLNILSHFSLHKHHLAWDKTIDNYTPYLYLPKHQIEIIYLCIFLYSFTKECIMCLLCTRCCTSF